jgi:hypothetical protein
MHHFEQTYAATCRRASTAAESSSVSVDPDLSADITAAKSAWYAQRRNCRRLRQQKCNAFWSERTEFDRADPRQLWQSVDILLDRGRSSINIETFNQFFVDIVPKVRASTYGASSPAYTPVQPGDSFRNFKQLSVNDIVNAIRLLPDKCSAADQIPTYVLRRISNLVAHFVAAFFNRSLEYGIFLAVFKQASSRHF